MESVSQKPSLTIGISAHNEERNIGNLLESLSTQKMGNYSLDSVTVFCDGCTDNTASIVKEFLGKNSKIILIDDGARLGKIGRVNSLCRSIQSDILVILDADIRIEDMNFIEKLVSGFINSDTGLVAGLQMPEKPRNFAENIFVTWEMIWIKTRKNLNKGVSIHNISGCNFAIKKTFYKNLIIPKEVIAEDEFLFLQARKVGVGFNFVSDAIVYYHLPSNFYDYFIQSARFMSTKHKILAHFDESSEEIYTVPFGKKFRALTVVFMHRPISTILAFIFQIPVRFYTRFNMISYDNDTYEPVKSTK